MSKNVSWLRAELFAMIHTAPSGDFEDLAAMLSDASVALDARMESGKAVTIPAVDRAATTTTDGRPVDEVQFEQRQSAMTSGQHKSYIILSDEERSKGFVRPVRRSYKHVGRPRPRGVLRDLTPDEAERYASCAYAKFEPNPDYPETSNVTGRFWTQVELDRLGKCGSVTTMGTKIAETYARDPKFYGATFCSNCGEHLPVGAGGEFVWVDDETQRVGT